MNKIDYNVTLEKEVLLEVMADIMSDVEKFMLKKNISLEDKDNETLKYWYNLINLKNSIMKPRTMEEILELKKKINEEKQKVKKLVA